MKEKLSIVSKINDSEERLTQTKKNNLKKYLIIGGSALVILILVIIIIILIINSSKSEDDDEDIDPPKTDPIGEIICKYDVDTTKNKTEIIGAEFIKKSVFDIFVDDELIQYTREVNFSIIGLHQVKFILYENLNMDYMFKNIKALISIEMNSTSNLNADILSMESTFENCYN